MDQSIIQHDKILAFITAMPEQCKTTAGAARMLADMSQVSSLRVIAQKWFSDLGRTAQLEMIRSLGMDGARARALVYLSPNAAPLLARLSPLQLRSICDDRVSLIASLSGPQMLRILRTINKRDALYLWIAMMAETLRDEPDWANKLFADASPDDLASPFVPLLGISSLMLLEEAEVNTLALEEVLPEVSGFFIALSDFDYELYRQTIRCLSYEVGIDCDRRNASRTSRLIHSQAGLWREELKPFGKED